jgi:hypothetical protein
MRNTFLTVAACVLALLSRSRTDAFDLCRVMALGCGDAYGSGCGGSACSGPSCASEPACGCGEGCGVNGRQFAGDTWKCCRECGPPICTCTGPSHTCGSGCGCADNCEPGCGCEPAPGCGTSRACCGANNCHFGGLFFASWCGRVVGCVDRFCGCTGCDGELYWHEWHNDPPRCCDPCDCHGNWVGSPHGGYRAPYEHPYNVAGRMSRPSFAARMPVAAPLRTGKPEGPLAQPVNPFRQQWSAVPRTPSVGANGTHQR